MACAVSLDSCHLQNVGWVCRKNTKKGSLSEKDKGMAYIQYSISECPDSSLSAFSGLKNILYLIYALDLKLLEPYFQY